MCRHVFITTPQNIDTSYIYTYLDMVRLIDSCRVDRYTAMYMTS